MQKELDEVFEDQAMADRNPNSEAAYAALDVEMADELCGIE